MAGGCANAARGLGVAGRCQWHTFCCVAIILSQLVNGAKLLESPLAPSRKAAGLGGGVLGGTTRGDQARSQSGSSSTCTAIRGSLPLYVEAKTEVLLKKADEELPTSSRLVKYNITITYRAKECSTQRGVLLEVRCLSPHYCRLEERGSLRSCTSSPFWKELLSWSIVFWQHANGTVDFETTNIVPSEAQQWQGAVPEHVKEFLKGLMKQVHIGQHDNDNPSREDTEHEDHVQQVQRINSKDSSLADGTLCLIEQRFQHPRHYHREQLFIPRASVKHTFLHPDRGLDHCHVSEVVEFPMSLGEGRVGFSRVTVKSSLGAAHSYNVNHPIDLNEAYPGGSYIAFASELRQAAQEREKAERRRKLLQADRRVWSTTLYVHSWIMTKPQDEQPDPGSIGIKTTMSASLLAAGSSTAQTFTSANFKTGMTVTLFGTSKDIEIPDMPFDVSANGQENKSPRPIQPGAPGSQGSVPCDAKADVSPIESALPSTQKTYWKQRYRFFAAGQVPVDVAVSVTGYLEQRYAYISCSRTSTVRRIPVAGLHGALKATGSVGLGTAFVEEMGAEVTVQMLAISSSGAVDWNVADLAMGSPWPTCVAARVAADGLGAEIAVYSRGLVSNTRKTIWSQKVSRFVNTYMKKCGRDIIADQVGLTWPTNRQALGEISEQGFGTLPAELADGGQFYLPDCPAGFRVCGAFTAQCTGTAFNNDNCGKCGVQVPAGYMCYNGYAMPSPPTPDDVAAQRGGYQFLEAQPVPASGDLGSFASQNERLKVHFRWKNGTNSDTSLPPPMQIGLKCMVNGVSFASSCYGVPNCYERNLTRLSKRDVVAKYGVDSAEAYPVWELAVDVNSTELPSFDTGEACVKCDLTDAQLGDLSGRGVYMRALGFLPNSLTNLEGDGERVLNRNCESVYPGDGAVPGATPTVDQGQSQGYASPNTGTSRSDDNNTLVGPNSLSSSPVTCFPGEARVYTDWAGSTVAMKDLRIGDSVVAVDADSGQLSLQPVRFFSHQSPEKALYVSLETDSGLSVAATPEHYVFASKAAGDHGEAACFASAAKSLVAARNVRIGDVLWVWERGGPHNKSVAAGCEGDGMFERGTLRPSRVVAVTHRRLDGLYNPHTSKGAIIVDRIAVAEFTELLPPHVNLYKAATLGAQLLSSLLSVQAAVRVNGLILNALGKS